MDSLNEKTPSARDLEAHAEEMAASSKLDGHMATHESGKWNDGAGIDHHGQQFDPYCAAHKKLSCPVCNP